jgi:hypothetical protein
MAFAKFTRDIMDTYGAKLHLNAEHKEFVKDVTNILIGYTPISGMVGMITFGEKWINKKKVPHRFAKYVHKNDRKNFIKSRSRRLKALHERSSAKTGYALSSPTR